MKKTVCLRISLLLLVSLIMTTTTVGGTSIAKDFPSLRIVAEEVNPEPVEPGQDVTVKVRIYNYPIYSIPGYTTTAENASVKLDVKYPFYLKAESRSSEECNICTGCSKDYTYYLVVDSSAVSGIYPITIKVTRGDVEREQDINIKIVGIPDMVFDCPPNKKRIKPGDDFSIRASFKNIGTGVARNIKVVPSSDKFIVLGSSLKVIDVLKPGEEVNLTLGFSVDESVSPGTYSIPVQLTFLDERSGGHDLSESIGVKVLHGAELNLQDLKIEPSILKVGDKVTIQVRVENVGDGSAENVKVILESGLEGYKKAYIGMLEKDDDTPAIFTLRANNEGELENKLVITYKDDFGVHNLTEEFTLTVKNNGNNDATFIATVIIAAALVAILVYFFFKRKKK